VEIQAATIEIWVAANTGTIKLAQSLLNPENK
jgi:hypothetical protein